MTGRAAAPDASYDLMLEFQPLDYRRLRRAESRPLVPLAKPRAVLPPLRSTNSYASPSFDLVQDSARLDAQGLPGIGFTTASWSA
jgi:hypothetical protein